MAFFCEHDDESPGHKIERKKKINEKVLDIQGIGRQILEPYIKSFHESISVLQVLTNLSHQSFRYSKITCSMFNHKTTTSVAKPA
jgi:hypothetical protein